MRFNAASAIFTMCGLMTSDLDNVVAAPSAGEATGNPTLSVRTLASATFDYDYTPN
ncbi:hypothetical protein B0H13DRAFT_2322908 [Mycena leptocephala]|nr:hypothetical protein B0H13DRAFT_2322908 [Mycena leptocephala]